MPKEENKNFAFIIFWALALLQGATTSFFVLPSAQYFAERRLELLLAISIFLYRFANLATSYLLVRFDVSARRALQLSALVSLLAGLSVWLLPNAVGIFLHQLFIGIHGALYESSAEVASRQGNNAVLTGGIRNALRAVTLGCGFIAGSILMFEDATFALLIIYTLMTAGTLLVLSLNVELERSKKQTQKIKFGIQAFFKEGLYKDPFYILLGGALLSGVVQNVATHWTAAFSEKAGWILGFSAILSSIFQAMGSAVINRWKSCNAWLILISRVALVVYPILTGWVAWTSETTQGLFILVIVWALVTMGPVFVKNVTSNETREARIAHLATSLAGLVASGVMALVIWLGPLSVAVLGMISMLPLIRFWRKHIPR